MVVQHDHPSSLLWPSQVPLLDCQRHFESQINTGPLGLLYTLDGSLHFGSYAFDRVLSECGKISIQQPRVLLRPMVWSSRLFDESILKVWTQRSAGRLLVCYGLISERGSAYQPHGDDTVNRHGACTA